jgi:hypothetical protein
MRTILFLVLTFLLFTLRGYSLVGAQQCDPADLTKVDTPFGCISADSTTLTTILINLGTGIGSGIAILSIIYAGFQMATAGGDPKKVQAAKELIIASLLGLSFIALSIVVLNFLGVDVLNLGGLGFRTP